MLTLEGVGLLGKRGIGMGNGLWNVFETTGKVEDYLRYKGESSSYSTAEQEAGAEELNQRKRTSEESVWEKPLR